MIQAPRYTAFSLSVKRKVEAYLLLPKQCHPSLDGQRMFSNPDFLDPSNNNLGNEARGFSPRVLCGSEGWQASAPPCEVTPESPWASVFYGGNMCFPKFSPMRDAFVVEAEKQNERSGIVLLLEG